jgi:hypothetical protein
MNEIVFHSPWDGKLTISTLVLSCVLLGGGVLTISVTLSTQMPRIAKAGLVFAGLIPFAAFVGAGLYAPRNIAVTTKGLIVHRIKGPVVIPLEKITRIDAIDAGMLASSTREFGVSGVFGYFGVFHNKNIGRYSLYASRSDGYVLVRADGPVVLTPERPDEFVSAVRERMAMLR